jgi:hypothetical protein
MEATIGEPAEVLANIKHHPAGGHHLVGVPGKQLLQDLAPASMETVRVLVLRHAFAMVPWHRKDVSLEDGDEVIEVRENPCRKQSAYACANDYRMLTDAFHLYLLVGRHMYRRAESA